MLTDLQIIDTFISRADLHNVLYAMKVKFDNETSLCETIISKKKISKLLKQQFFSKLSTVFRRQVFLDKEEAISFYGKRIDILEERMDILYDMIDFINENLEIDFIPDRLMMCAFFRISAETYDAILNDARADITDRMRNDFKIVEELMLSLTTNAIENGIINCNAWKRLSLKAKFGGSEIETIDSEYHNKKNTILVTTNDEIQKRLGTAYNFAELGLEEKKEG